MRHRRFGLAVGLSALLLAGGCGPDPEQPSGQSTNGQPDARASARMWPGPLGVLDRATPDAWWSGSSARDLAPTGIEVMTNSEVDGMAADGTGVVWLHSPWRLIRVDVVTGSNQVWDAGDDAAFAGVRAVRGSSSAGVWLVSEDRLTLFDGERFVRDLPVPAEFRGGPTKRINDMVEVGPEIWVSTPVGVARYARGTWSMVGRGQISMAGQLEVDSEGFVWSEGQLATEDFLTHAVVRFDGSQWRTPDPSHAPTSVDELLGDPRGGVVVRAGLDVRRFDGSAWRSIPLPWSIGGVRDLRGLALAIAPDGVRWLVWPGGLATQRPRGGWRTVAPSPDPLSSVGLSIVAGEVLVTGRSGLYRLDGDAVNALWTTGESPPATPTPDMVVASSGRSSAQEPGTDADSKRWRAFWRALGWAGVWSPQVHGSSRVALATDGAVWGITGEGLVRSLRGDRRVVAGDAQAGWLLAGPDGSVWLMDVVWSDWSGWYAEYPQEHGLHLIAPDGSRTSVSLPGPVWSLTSLAAGVDGSLWATICEQGRVDYCTAPALMRWDGQWSTVPYPGAGITGVSVSPDGAFWATLTRGISSMDSSILARYSDGTWTQFPDGPTGGSVTPAPGGGVCGIVESDEALVCVARSGDVTSTPVGVTGRLRIGLDGSLWLVAPDVVALLPGTLPD